MAAMFLSIPHSSNQVSIPKRVSEVLWLLVSCMALTKGFVSIPKSVSEVLWPVIASKRGNRLLVSIPKRVSEVLWPDKKKFEDSLKAEFQSLKGFQRFCGRWTSLLQVRVICFNP